MVDREAMKQKKVGLCCGKGILYREYRMQASWGSIKVFCLLSCGCLWNYPGRSEPVQRLLEIVHMIGVEA